MPTSRRSGASRSGSASTRAISSSRTAIYSATGFNIAARLEGIAEPGGICVSARVQEDATGRLNLDFEDIGEQALKNIARPVRVYRVLGRNPHPNPPPQAGEGTAIAGPMTSPPRAGEGRA